jgi:ApeA N-terminal domain 1/Apea-like HEPN
LKEWHTEEFEYKGRWWVPDASDFEVRGTLKLIPNKEAILDLEGIFKNLEGKYTMSEQSIILGITSEDEYITLLECQPHGLRGDIHGLKFSSFRANKVFKGIHFTKPHDIKFTSVSVRYSNLDVWVDIKGFDMQLLPDEDIVIKYKAPKPVIANLNDDYKVSLIRAGFPNYVRENEVSIREKKYIMIETKEEKLLEEYETIIKHIQNFLSLGVTEPVYPLNIQGKSKNGKTVDIYDLEMYINETTRDLLTSDMLFTLKSIADRFEELLRNWIRKADLLDSVYILYFSTLFNPHLYLEVQFLNLVHAIESYHSRTMRDYDLPEKEFEKRKKIIIDSVPNDYKDYVESKLSSNRPNLAKRLGEVFGKCTEVISNFVKDTGSVIDKVVKTRNYLIHRNPKLKSEAAKGDELIILTQKLKILIEICLLNELGFTFAEIKNLFLKNSQYEYFHRIWNK